MLPGAEQDIFPPMGNTSPQKWAKMPSLRPSSTTILKGDLRGVQMRLKMKRRIPMRRGKGRYIMASSTKGVRRHEGTNIECSKTHESHDGAMGHLQIC